ncbi:MAG: hypothetical protein JWQ81_731 [Amycolatopsis sp.]|jgi:hypothetical protein|uniref:DUF6372 family protein n=1 Tax=Amycolatopsis sp. TaxID=37632 RepID=UPI0026258D3E|nr:DUF6372 family protein [Amycolatopsis sp.]MCU1679992.1 hypothetical protein [Amycolatopsis sp.]
MITECQCLCAPLGHSFSICEQTARPGVFVKLGSTPGAGSVPACPSCFEAMRERLFAAALTRSGSR